MGTTEPTGAMTVEKLMEMAQKLRDIMPKASTFLVSRYYPAHENIKVEGRDETFVLMHPSTLERVLHETRKSQMQDTSLRNPSFGGIPIFEMDVRADDTPERCLAIQRMTNRLTAALNQAIAIYAEKQRKEKPYKSAFNLGVRIHKSLINTDMP